MAHSNVLIGALHAPAWSCLHVIGWTSLRCRLERRVGKELGEQCICIKFQVRI